MNNLVTGKPVKILLVNPPYQYFGKTGGKKAQYTEPPLGVAYLAGYALKFFGDNIDIKILDAAALTLSLEETIKEVEKNKPDILGVTVVTLSSNLAVKIITAYKKTNPGALTLVGGPHVTALPYDLIPPADIACIGEGEETFREIIEYYQAKRSIDSIKGIAYLHETGKCMVTEGRPYLPSVDIIPFPARHLLPMEKYQHQYPYPTKNRNYATMMTTRGCPFRCSFCGVKKLWGRAIRERSVENILAELDELVNIYQVSFISIFDETFTFRKKRVMEFCDRIIDRKYDIKWACFSRVNTLDEELLKKMKQAGCIELQVGVESGDEAVLKNICKDIDLKTVIKAFDLIKNAGINTKAFFMIGNPGETPATIEKTIKFSLELDPTYAFYSILIPFPGIPIHDEYKARGFIKTYNWGKYNWYLDPVFETDTLSAKDMIRLRRKAEMVFYLRPARVWKAFIDAYRAKKMNILFRNFLAWLSIVLPHKKEER
ncbi:MAG: radical SAM protein [Nitrospirae bacterium]|nr:radical SAM protein [Nitrospirota bacterium]